MEETRLVGRCERVRFSEPKLPFITNSSLRSSSDLTFVEYPEKRCSDDELGSRMHQSVILVELV